jgi:hypothetical protein
MDVLATPVSYSRRNLFASYPTPFLPAQFFAFHAAI